MAYADLPLDVMRSHVCDQQEPADLDEFWAGTLDEARTFDRAPVFDRVATGLPLIDTYDVSFPGWGGHPIAGWLHVPAGTTTPLPCVVTYIGYGSGRGLPHDNAIWALAGYAMLVMDTRGQGSDGRAGNTPDPAGTGPAYPGFMTRGVESPETYYYRRLITDAVRAVDTARGFRTRRPGADRSGRRQPGRRVEHRGRRPGSGRVRGNAGRAVPL